MPVRIFIWNTQHKKNSGTDIQNITSMWADSKKDLTGLTSLQGERGPPERLPCPPVWWGRLMFLTPGCFPQRCPCQIPSPCPRLPPRPRAPPPLQGTAGTQRWGQGKPACTWWPDRPAPSHYPGDQTEVQRWESGHTHISTNSKYYSLKWYWRHFPIWNFKN